MTKIHQWSVAEAGLDLGKLCCAIGNFDGVHKGHQALIAVARKTAQQSGLPLAVVCFSPHPRRYFQPSNPPFLLMDSYTKAKMLAAEQVDFMIEIHFDERLQTMSPEDFVRIVLYDALDVSRLFAGADFAFGKGRVGTVQSLTEISRPLGMAVEAVSLVSVSDTQVVSSSAIRDALQKPDLLEAKSLLGRPHIISGLVAEGDKRGRQLNFPTANIILEDKLAPAFGVYAVTATVELANGHEALYKGVANIGKRPTVNDRGILAEAHLFNFNENIYGRRLNLYLEHFIRPEQKFDGLEALTTQIRKDVTAAFEILNP